MQNSSMIVNSIRNARFLDCSIDCMSSRNIIRQIIIPIVSFFFCVVVLYPVLLFLAIC